MTNDTLQTTTPTPGRKNINILGGRFGKWLVVSVSNRRAKNGSVYWLCVCDCGRKSEITVSKLIRGESKQCSFCNSFKHGLYKHPIYYVWLGIKARCLNPNSGEYKNYGKRGIGMCQEWQDSFVNFYNDMVSGYEKGLQIDRIDNNGNYCKENCRWATPAQNSNNTRKNIIMTLGNKSQTLAEWAKELRISPDSLYGRKVKLGWSDFDCLTKKLNKNGNRIRRTGAYAGSGEKQTANSPNKD